MKEWVEEGLLGAILQSWVVFCILSLFGGVLGLISEHPSDPLSSDDPYLLGFLVGGTGAALSAVYSGCSAYFRNRRNVDFGYIVALLTWCCFLWLMAIAMRGNPDGADDIYRMFGLASLVLGMLTWPLSRVRIPVGLIVALSIAEVGLLGMYLTTVARMAARTF